MRPWLKKLLFAIHITASLGWLGAVLAYLAVAIASLRGSETALAIAMNLIGWWVIVPCSVLAGVSGSIQSLAGQWELHRYWWIVVKFVLTLLAIAILLGHMPRVSALAALAAASPHDRGLDPGLPQVAFVVHAAGGLLVLLIATLLSVYKPWGRTPFAGKPD